MAARVSLVLFYLVSYEVSVAQVDSDKQLEGLFRRDSITIVITDSGLGGLSVCADIELGLNDLRVFRTVNLVFVNALPDAGYTYNAMTSKEEQVRVFNDALSGMNRWYHPDAILIACNTLSALYPETPFAKDAEIPVVSIIDVGSRMIADRMKESSTSLLMILGTQITIASGLYSKQLLSQGISQDRIVSQACRLLETEIQSDPTSDLVSNLIEAYVSEALEKIGRQPTEKIFVGLCCSHYGYSLGLFRQTLRQSVGENYELLNPNKAMTALFAGTQYKNKFKRTDTKVKVVSRAKIADQEVRSIAALLEKTSIKAAQALRRYTFKEDLFLFER